MTVEERADAIEKLIDSDDPDFTVSGQQAEAGVGLSDPETGDTTSSSAGPFNKGGLASKTKKKKNKK